MGRVTAPALLTTDHIINDFDCKHEILNQWLFKKALKNQQSGASKTFVCCEESNVIGFYSLATGSIEHQLLSANIRRNMPSPIPVIVLTRLAVNFTWQGKGLGKHLLKDALLRCLHVSENIGVRAVIVHALNGGVAEFYRQYGFVQSNLNKHTLVISIKTIKQNLLH